MNVWIVLAYQLLRRAFANATLWSWIEGYVADAEAQAGLSGGEKRAWVAERLAALPESQRAALAALANWLINLAIEAMVAKLKVSKAG